MKGGQKVLSLAIVHNTFVTLNIMELIYELLLVFFKTCMLYTRLLYEIP